MPPLSWKQIRENAKKDSDDFKPIPADDYNFIISKAEHRLTVAAQKDSFSCHAKVIDGPNKNRIVFHTFTISLESSKAMNYFFSQMNVLGLGDDFWDADPSNDEIAAALVGKVFIGKVEIEPDFKDATKDRNVIKNMSTPSEETRRLALSVATTANPNPTPDPTASAPPAPTGVPSGGAVSAPPAPSPEVAPPPPPPAPPASGGLVPPPPPPPPAAAGEPKF